MYIGDDIASGQINKRKYKIYQLLENDRCETLMFWYLIMYNDTYSREFENYSDEKEQQIAENGIDIRTLINYKKLKAIDIVRDKSDVIKLIRDSIKSGEIIPI